MAGLEGAVRGLSVTRPALQVGGARPSRGKSRPQSVLRSGSRTGPAQRGRPSMSSDDLDRTGYEDRVKAS